MGSKKYRNAEEPKLEVPIYIPTEDGQAGDLALGMGEMRGSTLIISFNDLIPAQAIAHRIARGGLVGITFIIPAEENDQHKANEDAIQAAQDLRRQRVESLREAGFTEEQIKEALALAEGLTDRDERDLALLEEIEPDDLKTD